MRSDWAVCSAMLITLLAGCGATSDTAPVASTPQVADSTVPAVSSSLTVATTDQMELQPVPTPESDTAGSSERTRAAQAAFERLVAAALGDRPDDWATAEVELKEFGADIVPALIPVLSDEQSLKRELAVMFLAQLGPEASPAREALLPLLNDPSPFIRVNTASLLTTFEKPPQEVVATLKDLLSQEDPNLRVNVLFALGNVPESAAELVPVIATSLADENPQIRHAAASTLGRLGESARVSLPQLKQLLDDADPAVKEAAMFAVQVLEPAVTPAAATAIPTSAESPAP